MAHRFTILASGEFHNFLQLVVGQFELCHVLIFLFGSGPETSPAAARIALEQTRAFARGRAAVRVARDIGKSRTGGLRGSYPEPGLGWQLRLRPSAHAVVPEFMRAAFVFAFTADGPMPNAGKVP